MPVRRRGRERAELARAGVSNDDFRYAVTVDVADGAK